MAEVVGWKTNHTERNKEEGRSDKKEKKIPYFRENPHTHTQNGETEIQPEGKSDKGADEEAKEE